MTKTLLIGFAVAAAIIVTTHGAEAQPSAPALVPEQRLLDAPDNTASHKYPEKGDAFSTTTCVYYPTFTVKYIENGDEGAEAISVTPANGPARPPCGEQDDPGETLLPDARGSVFIGAKGEFLYLISPEGYAFSIYSATTSKRLYQDERMGDDGVKALSATADKLTLRYLRRVAAACSLASGDASCWPQTIRAAHLPAAIASQPAPTALCRAAYAASGRATGQPVDPKDPSEIGYEATVEIGQNGRSTVLQRGPISYCGPQE